MLELAAREGVAARKQSKTLEGEVAYRDLREFVKALDPPSQRLASADLRVLLRNGLLRRT